MGKKKKKNWRRQINPEKSNKMIIAVGIGLTILFVAFVLLTTGSGGSKNKAEQMYDSLNYLKKTGGIFDVRIVPEHNRVKIIYDSQDKKDFTKIARFAGLKLSNKLKSQRLEIQLIRENQDTPHYRVVLENGQVLKEETLTPNNRR